MNVGDFVIFNSSHKGIVTAMYLYLLHDDEYEETFMIKILESKYYCFNEAIELPYYSLDLITDEKEINRLNKIMVFK